MFKATFEHWYNNVNDLERKELDLIKNDENEIKERFSLNLAFGTAGMRGEVGLGTYRMNTYTVKRATAGVAEYLKSLGKEAMQRGVVVAYDTRRFSREFALNVAEVLTYYGINCYLFEDVRPVPMCSYSVRALGAEVGVMITASHNPKEYNGYKVYGADGAQMSPESTKKVVEYIEKIEDPFTVKSASIPMSAFPKGVDGVKLNEFVTIVGKSVDEGYFNALEKLLLSKEIIATRGKDIKLVYTPIHGAGYYPVTTMFNRLGINATVVQEQANPDTEFSTVRVPNPENADTLSMGVALGNKIGADVVLGTDPDSDRLGVAVRDNKGEFILLTGNQIGILLLDYIITKRAENGTLPANGALVKTIVTSTLADRFATSRGVTVFNVLTGFKFIGEKIKEWEQSGEYEYLFGFEESYGSLSGTHARDKDAVIASVLFAEMLMYLESKGSGVYNRLQELFKEFGYYSENNTSITYKGLSGMSDMKRVMDNLRLKTITEIGGEKVLGVSDYLSGKTKWADGSIEDITLPKSDVIYLTLEDGQFICIRPSGTEPKLKIYVLIFADTQDGATAKSSKLMQAVKQLLED
ncbi:MAG: phospho-sugar mutase [Clostridia bacterium]|nr:phospho-sugar mutase [Clostridia bacterium]